MYHGKLTNVSKDNFENAKLVVTDGENERAVSIDTNFEDGALYFSTSKINNAIELQNIVSGKYYVLLRLKLNNSVNAKYYSLKNVSSYNDIEFYTITKNNENKKIDIAFEEKEYNGKKIEYLAIDVNLAENGLPEYVYDFCIDSGHGGKDVGEKSGNYTEANITLEYAEMLKEALEESGYKVKLTRTEENSSLYNYTNMYDLGGRIETACESKAKYMFSFHVNNGDNGLSGLEIYAPCKSHLGLAKLMADSIVRTGAINYSNNNGFKEQDGVFVWNFTKPAIKDFTATANKKGYAPYDITQDTNYQYTIREVGGIATNAYVDGRNKEYSANKYYNTNQGIECYQIELGYIKNDLDSILNNKESYIDGIVQAIKEYLED